MHVRVGLTLHHPVVVTPAVAINVGKARGGSGRALGPEGIGVSLVETLARCRLDHILIQVANLGTRDKSAPNPAGGKLLQRIGSNVPVVEVADHVNRTDVRDPDGKAESLLPVACVGVGAHLLEAAIPLALAHDEDVSVGDVSTVNLLLHGTLQSVPGNLGAPRGQSVNQCVHLVYTNSFSDQYTQRHTGTNIRGWFRFRLNRPQLKDALPPASHIYALAKVSNIWQGKSGRANRSMQILPKEKNGAGAGRTRAPAPRRAYSRVTPGAVP